MSYNAAIENRSRLQACIVGMNTVLPWIVSPGDFLLVNRFLHPPPLQYSLVEGDIIH